MTQEAETATNEAATQEPHWSADLLGLAYLGTLGIVMAAWISGLMWAGTQAVKWLIS
jgi:hypothetical protein